MRSRRTVLFTLLLQLAIWGCQSVPVHVQPHPEDGLLPPASPQYGEAIQVRYLGSGGYIFQRGDVKILGSPFYSNPHWLKVGLRPIRSDTVHIDRHHPYVEIGPADAILVGHAHYDHLLDMPYLARKYHAGARIYGNTSVVTLSRLAEPSLGERLVDLTPVMAEGDRPGQWIYLADSTARIMAIAAEHGPHAIRTHVMQGKIDPGLQRLPRSVWRWKEGQTLVFLIDFLDQQENIDFRIYYADATTVGTTGYVPDLPPDQVHPIDLAVLCVGSAHVMKNYPEQFIRDHDIREVMLGHWENFFRPLDKPLKRMRGAHVRRFIKEIELASPGIHWRLPDFKATYIYTAE